MKVAVIGIGCISQLHVRSILACGQELVALCDVDLARCEKVNAQYGILTKNYTDYLQMLDECDIDAVHVCTPHYLHQEMICACLRRNIHVLTEKPLAISLAQLQEIEKAVRESKATLGVCHQRRYEKSMQYVKRLFEQEKAISGIGTLCWRRDESYYVSEAWRGKWATEGGGVAINQALHTLDLLLWFFGTPDSVIGHKHNDSLQGVIEVEDSVFSTFKFADGRKFFFNATNACNTSLPVSILVEGEKTRAVIVNEWLLVNDQPIKKQDSFPKWGKKEWGIGHAKLIRDFYDCLQSGKKFALDFYEGEKVVKLILALYQSNGKEIQIL